MIYTEIHTNEYSSITQMIAAAASCKFHTDKEKQEVRVQGVRRGGKREKETRIMNLNEHWQPFVYQTFLHYQDELMNKDSNTLATQTA